jgi:hypothetical protein
MQLAPGPDPLHFVRPAPVFLICRFRLPPFLARRLARFPAAHFGAEPLVMMIAGIGGEPFFTARAPAMMAFHIKHHHLSSCRHN